MKSNDEAKSAPSREPPRALALGLDEIEAALRAMRGRRVLVHHFATWCEPCEEELPLLGPLLTSCGDDVRRVAIAWDLFLVNVKPQEAVKACAEFLQRQGATFDDLFVYTGTPESLFASQKIDDGTVPFTELRDVNGVRMLHFQGPLFEEQDRQRLRAALLQRSKGLE